MSGSGGRGVPPPGSGIPSYYITVFTNRWPSLTRVPRPATGTEIVNGQRYHIYLLGRDRLKFDDTYTSTLVYGSPCGPILQRWRVYVLRTYWGFRLYYQFVQLY